MSVKKIESFNKHENPSANTDQFNIEDYLNENWDKILDVVDNNADELIGLQNTNTTEIEKLKTENEMLRSQIPTRQNKRESNR